MVITKTPLRIEFLGGSTDIENYYTRDTGRVLNAALDKYVYVMVKERFGGGVRVVMDEIEEVSKSAEVKHKYTKAALEMFGIEDGVEIISVSDIHTKGSGLGSSSSFAVGLLNALSAYKGKKLSKLELAEMACHLEIDLLSEPIGKQDQYAAAYGGFSNMTFNKDGKVDVKTLKLPNKTIKDLEKLMLVFYTGKSRSTSNLLREQHKEFERTFPLLQQMAGLVPGATESLEAGDLPLFADFLFKEWTVKKQLMPGITNDEIEGMYAKTVENGAWGGRVSGAGGGGFMYVIAPENKHQEIIKALSGYERVKFGFSEKGSEVIY